ncbi:RND family transporter [Pseudomonas sp. R3.Fl]|uniref:efflux RND transporter permease subunit n=1 Tax=Pseudomonas TaxID=286 RepID=UPI00201D6839|nr:MULTISPECIES: RND family transporter [Pseudomonas]MCL6691897.1 RND family transporter [Pseudomonas sp. R3.Fl]MCP1605075.1 putative RND superfamily exporter protein [Pseudomonas citronellolis]MCP1642656.1 putative RND superfamily exporter protein [Pseudomonas citronellolis]MCP1655923.1 putative RND superfamily exporter protein [Pseudomonas citronellolis]MCP1665580.1 putative RND superfamily exporter protein [Pseudomonas citronellolis]
MNAVNSHHQDKATLLERLIFNNRPVVIVICLLVTLFLAFQATQVRPSTSFEKMIPLKHPFIQNMLSHINDLSNLGNTVRISVEAVNGDIFTKEYMDTLRQIHDEVFYIPGVDRSGLKSLWSPSVRWTEVTEEGFAGGEVIPQTYDGSAKALDKLRDNVLKSGQIGRLVANNFKSSIVDVPLLEVYPDAQDQSKLLKLDYRQFSHELEEKIRDKYQAQNPNVKIHIVGFAKKVGDLIDGLVMVVGFFGICFVITLVLLLWFTKCVRSTIAVLSTTLVAVIWQLGLLHTIGFGLDPYSMLVPFLIFAIGISHGVQKINGIALQSSDAETPLLAARRTFRQLFLPGMIAILADAVGFITLLVIDIGVIRELAIGASIGVAVIVFTNLILLPVAISYIGISKRAVERSKKDAVREHPFWRLLSNFASAKVAPISILIALVMFAGGLWQGHHLKIGDLDQGAPELRPDSRYNLDNDFIIRNYSTSSDVLVVMVESAAEGCSAHQTLQAIDELSWKLENTEGVQSAISLVTVSKQVIKGMNEGNLKWETLSRNKDVLNNSISRADGLYNSACSLAPLLVFLNDHKAETLDRAVLAVQEFAKDHEKDDLKFKLAAGNAGIEAATNEVIKQSELIILVLVYICVAVMCMITFRSFTATLCIVLPLILTSVLGNALMATLGIGVKVATLPVIALGVGIGVDYGIYIYTRLESFLRQGLSLQEAYYETLKSTGKAVLFTGLCLAIGVATWIFSAIKFQADMGLMLTFMLLWNMFGALWLLPALARFLINPEKVRAKKASILVH